MWLYKGKQINCVEDFGQPTHTVSYTLQSIHLQV